MSESIGMMDKAYFVGKQDILNWMNSHLSVSASLMFFGSRIRQSQTMTFHSFVLNLNLYSYNWQRLSSVQLAPFTVPFSTLSTQVPSPSAKLSGKPRLNTSLLRTTRCSNSHLTKMESRDTSMWPSWLRLEILTTLSSANGLRLTSIKITMVRNMMR